MTLERVVRPFQSDSSFPTTRVTLTPPETVENVVIAVGLEGGNVKKMNGSFSLTKSKYCDQKSKTYPKKVVTQRIKNPDDEEQYVDVDVLDKIQTKRGAGQDYLKWTDTAHYDKLNSDAEIIDEQVFPDVD